LSYGNEVEIVEPIIIREKIAKKLEETLKQYRN